MSQDDISVVINSASLGPRSRSVLSSGGRLHGERATLLRTRILPTTLASPEVSEVIVTGEFEDGDGYRYVSAPSERFDCTDALHQRAAGFKVSRGDFIVFQHDDHCADPDFFHSLRERYVHDDTWDVLVPSRWAMDADTPRKVNNGSADGYVMGHASVFRRAIAAAVPWTHAPQAFTWDVGHTALLRQQGARIRWVDDLAVWDLEATLGATPW